MKSQDSPAVIPCSEDMAEEDNDSVVAAPPPPEESGAEKKSDDPSQSQSLLTESDNNGDSTVNQDEEISSINVSAVNKLKSGSVRNSGSNSIMEMESSEINPLSSTRIEQDNSMSLLNEGFMIDSASLSLSAVNEDSRLDPNKTTAETNDTLEDHGDGELGAESPEAELEPEDEDMEDDSVEVHSPVVKRRKENVEIDEDDDDDDENCAEYPEPQFPMARVRRIMAFCASAEDDDANHETETTKSKGKGKGNIVITKEAIYLTALATEHFISAIGEMAGGVAVSSKKKTLTLDHLKRALSEKDAFAFLEGCFQPSIIIGD